MKYILKLYYSKLYNLIIKFYKKNNNELRVLIFHHIDKENFNKFEIFIDHLDKEWNIITPYEFQNFIINKNKINGKNVLITFDDGFISNLYIYKKILKKRNIKSIFFIIKNSLINNQHKLNIIKKNLLINKKNLKFMSYSNILMLNKEKNIIGFHTNNHTNISNINNFNDLKYEIDINTEYSSINNDMLNHFAFPFGTIGSLNNNFTEIKNKFKFLYTGIRGNNLKFNSKKLILRDSIDINDPLDINTSILNGGFDIFYYFKRKLLINFEIHD